MEKRVCKVELTGCMSFDTFLMEIPDAGSREACEAAAEERYTALFGKFESRYCDQCHDSTSMSIELLTPKQSKKAWRRWKAGRSEPRFYPL